MQIKRQWGRGGCRNNSGGGGVGFSQQCSPYRLRATTRTGVGGQTRGSHWVQICSRADQWVALLRKKKKSQLNTVCRQRPRRVFCFLPNYLRQAQEQTGGEHMALPLRDPHVLWGWWMPYPPSRHGRGRGVCDRVQESSHDKQSTSLNYAFLQEQLRIQVSCQLFSSLPIYSEAPVCRPCTVVLAVQISTMLPRAGPELMATLPLPPKGGILPF